MKTLTSLVLVSLVLVAACVATAPTVKYYHTATGKRLAASRSPPRRRVGGCGGPPGRSPAARRHLVEAAS